MKKAVMYGAGNIGRGFIGKTFSESGYEVCFIDIAIDIVDKLDKEGCYPVKIVTNEERYEDIVKNVHAVSGFDIDRVAKVINEADIMAIAVGVNVLPKIVKPVCEGLKKRFDRNGEPLNIIICENLIDADHYLRKMIEEKMGDEYKQVLGEKLGLIKASIGRMVPIMTNEMREGNILKVWVEPYDVLPVDKNSFVGDIPRLNGLVPFSPFGFYIKRKLFIHNMAHAMLAYLGWKKGYVYIYECVTDSEIKCVVRAAMKDMAYALNKEYSIPINELYEHIKDLLYRFGNKALGDTVKRVGKDPLRKLGNKDRLVGAALCCEAQGIETRNIVKGIVAGLEYNNATDESAIEMHAIIDSVGIDKFIESNCGLQKGSNIFKNIKNLYKNEK